MASRYYLCDVVGDGTEDNPYRAALEDEPGIDGIATVIASGPDGRPVYPYALCVVESDDHQRLRNRKNVDVLPEVSLDNRMSAVSQVARARLDNAISRRNIPTTGLQVAEGYRDVIRLLGRRLDPAFDPDAFRAPPPRAASKG